MPAQCHGYLHYSSQDPQRVLLCPPDKLDKSIQAEKCDGRTGNDNAGVHLERNHVFSPTLFVDKIDILLLPLPFNSLQKIGSIHDEQQIEYMTKKGTDLIQRRICLSLKLMPTYLNLMMGG
ncbi:hypothetical protein A9255_04065 [Xenorhabdus hominickii]|uniref:Uncharacterized protein n=1 Tax=Xenorhabdus hominickii TaxID=351679 RepID=A0ABM6DPL4_XENHO|nr:hypothetical protein A9255_04065 [Xenorhabdus hominickii]